MRENVGARGAICRGQEDQWRGARGKQKSPLMASFNSGVTGAEENGSVPFTCEEMEGRLRGAHSYTEEAAGGTWGGSYTGQRWWSGCVQEGRRRSGGPAWAMRL
jgi:hypothetical protein